MMALVVTARPEKGKQSLLYRCHKSTRRNWKAVYAVVQLETLNTAR